MPETRRIVQYLVLSGVCHPDACCEHPMLWGTILKYHSNASEGYFDHFWNKPLVSKDYHEISLFLTVLEQKEASTDKLIEQMVPLLAEEYSILNRRVYWFLKKQKLSALQKQALKAYYDRYADYLCLLVR